LFHFGNKAEETQVISSPIAGVQIWPLRNKPDGKFDLDEVEEKVRGHEDDYEPKISLICVENTHNWCGGNVLPLEWLDDVSDVHRL
jgi:threonine aldolase